MKNEYRVEYRLRRPRDFDVRKHEWSDWRTHTSASSAKLESLSRAARTVGLLSSSARQKFADRIIDREYEYRLLERPVGEWRVCKPQLELELEGSQAPELLGALVEGDSEEADSEEAELEDERLG